MAKKKLDGVVEAVRYTPDGQVLWVRAYLRRGPTYSDRLILKRDDLINELKSGKIIYAGKRIEQMASTFEVTQQLKLVQKNGHDTVVLGDQQANGDRLDGIPLV
jgi:hypothetical protein